MLRLNRRPAHGGIADWLFFVHSQELDPMTTVVITGAQGFPCSVKAKSTTLSVNFCRNPSSYGNGPNSSVSSHSCIMH